VKLSSLLCTLLFFGTASAAPPRVSLRIHPCAAVPADEVRRLAALELGTLFTDELGPATTQVEVDCQAGAIRLRVDDRVTGKMLERSIALDEAPAKARGRLLALAVAELVSTSWSELELPSLPVPVVAPPSPSLQAAVRGHIERTRLGRLRLELIAGGLVFFSGARPILLGGTGIRLAKDHAHHLGWVVDVSVHHGTAPVTLGTVQADVLSAAGQMVVHQAWRHTALHIGVGLRGGATRLAGDAGGRDGVLGAVHWGPWLGPLVSGSLAFSPARRLALDLGVEAGYVASSVRGLVQAQPEVAVAGAWFSFQCGLGIFL